MSRWASTWAVLSVAIAGVAVITGCGRRAALEGVSGTAGTSPRVTGAAGADSTVGAAGTSGAGGVTEDGLADGGTAGTADLDAGASGAGGTAGEAGPFEPAPADAGIALHGWINRTPDTFPADWPPGRQRAAVVYDRRSKRVIVYGGSGSGQPLQDTWEWNGATGVWTRRAVTPPSVFDGAAATWDASVGNVALFGGRTFPGKAISNELWRLGVAWEKAPPATAGTPWPPALYSALLAHDASRGRLVLVGNGAPAPTWEWDHTTLAWSDRSTAGGPKNNLGAFAWDERRHVGVFFGAEAWGETWEWDGVSGVWTRKQFPSEKAPAPRFLAAAAYDSDAGRVLLFGGGLADSPGVHGWTGDLWEWDGTSWTLLEADGPAGPDEREAHGIAYDSDRHCLVVFGGSTFNSEPRDLWEWHR